jgi:hypothetical protein
VRTKKPSLRITRWLRSRRQPIPLEAECTACSDAQFKIKHDKRSETRPFGAFPPVYAPNGDHFRATLERQFDEHMKLVHPDEVS